MSLARKVHGFLIAAFCLLAAASSHAAILHQETLTVVGSATSSLNVGGVQGGTDQLYLTAVTIYETGISVSSVSGGGLTWTLQKTQCAARLTEPRIEVWQAFGSPGAPFSTVVTLSAAAQRASAAVSRYSGADPTTPTEGAAGSNTNGLNGACGGGTDNANLSLSLTSTRNDSVLYVASHPRNQTLIVEDAAYTQRAFVSNSGGPDGANLYIHDRALATAGIDSADHTATAATDWDMAGLVIRPAAVAIYYSVGTDNTALYLDTASAVTGTLTLTNPAADRIGVGDEIREGANRYYITGRNSATEFIIQDSGANGGTPGDSNITFGSTAITIFRAFNSLSAAESGSSDANHLNTVDLVVGGFQLNWTCYDDDALDDTVSINGYTTEPSNYIHIYTPTETNEVGVSQRHDGTAGTGFRVAPMTSTPPALLEIIAILDDDVRITGIEIDGSSVTNAQSIDGIEVSSVSAASDIRFHKLIVHDLQSQDGGGADADVHGFDLLNGSVSISNSIIYDLEQSTAHASASVRAVMFRGGSLVHYLHNNTIFNIKNTGSPTPAYGVREAGGTVTVKNTVVLDVESIAGSEACFSGTLTQSNNVSSDATAVGATNQTSYATYFKDTTNGAENLHLRNDSNNLWGLFGADLDSDPNLPVTDDIDGEARDPSTPDIGADEVPASVNYRSIGINAAVLHNVGTATTVVDSNIVTFTLPLPANIGLGDRLTTQPGGAPEVRYILSRDSDTQVTLQTPSALNRTDTFTILRAYNSLPAWEDDCAAVPGCLPSSGGGRGGDLVADNRREIGVAYNDGDFTSGVLIQGSTTDAMHTITLTVAVGNRHYGIEGNGVRLDNGGNGSDAVSVEDDFVSVEWLEIINGSAGADGIDVRSQNVSNKIVLGNNLVHDVGQDGIHLNDADLLINVYNNIVYDAGVRGIRFNTAPAQASIFNNTIYSCSSEGMDGDGGSGAALRNNISHSNGGADFNVSGINADSSNNLSGDATALTHSPNQGSPNGIQEPVLANLNFVDDTAPGINLHITAGSTAEGAGADLSTFFTGDIDGGFRAGAWDIGADDIAATTAVELLSFTALGGDGAVELRWETGSEVDNVGFYLYRATSEAGPYQLVNPSMVPGLGSSPLGASYRYVDSGLVNGQTYFYELEDLESTGVRERHGPVSATPLAGASFDSPPSEEDEGGEEEDGSSSDEHTITYGNPEDTRLRVLKRSRRQVVLELITGGFYAEPQEDGSVRLSIPGFLEDWEPGSPAIPVKRTWLQAVVGKQVKIASVKAKNVEAFSLRPTSAELLEPVMLPDGTVSLASTAQQPGKAFRGQGLYPENPVQVVTIAFQGDVKKAFLELAPLRWDRSTGQLLLARRLLVKVKFRGKVPGEKSLGGSRGRKRRKKNAGSSNVVANLVTHDSGLYGVSYRALFGNRGRGVKTRKLNLAYQGEPVAFYVLPNKKQFKRGSRLYFLSGGEEQNPYGREAVYVLSVGGGGQKMARGSASPSGSPVDHYWKTLKLEENHLFQGRLTTAPDVWLWDFLLAPVTKAYPFNVQGLASTSESGSLTVWLQGTTNLPTNPDHHIRIYLNGLLLQDFTLEGELPWMGEISVLPGALLEGQNTLELENVGDTGAAYSRIMLNRFEVTYPRQLVADSGQLRGSFGEAGTAEVTGFTGNALLLDTTGPVTQWLRGAESFPGGLRFRAQEDHRYLLADSTAVMTPEIRRPFSYRLKTMSYGANYVVIGPQELLEAAWPLLELRIGQGLTVLAVPIEQIYSEFGHGETRPDAIRDFLGYAYHNWRTPPRYVLLLGDATFDFKDYFGWGVQNQVPPFPIKSNYLWTASDPAYAAVNGDDLLPDIAIGRLPAANLDEARAMIDKIVTYENEGQGLDGKAVLIADRPDPSAGDFEANAEELAATLLSGNDVEKIYLDELGAAATHDSILSTFDEGASLVSYIGHGAMNLWSENILRTDHVDSLGYPAHYPLLLTMNCLNGYFQFPTYDSLSETLLKADGKGIIAAFSPSGESLDAPAHFYHRLLLAELLHGGHKTLGDAVLEAQSKFAETGGYLELLSIYHLFGDPAMKLQNNP